MPASKNLVQALAVTAELTGTQLSTAAARVMAEDVAQYPEQQVLKSLVRCRRELRGKLTIAEILSRLDDGRPGPEEAWARLPRDESASAFWTEEMREAFFVCRSLLNDGDHVQARMAFLETYKAKVQLARDEGAPVSWSFSPGTDPFGRESAVRDALHRGLISAPAARALLPAPEQEDGELMALMSGSLKRIDAKPAQAEEEVPDIPGIEFASQG